MVYSTNSFTYLFIILFFIIALTFTLISCSNTTTEPIILPVFDQTQVSIEVAENVFGSIHTAEATGGTITYELSGTDSSLFDLDQTEGELSFKSPPDFENPMDQGTDNVYDVIITANNDDGSINQEVSVTVTDIANVIFTDSVSDLSVDENTTAVIYQAMATGDGSITYTLSGTDADDFNIDIQTGEITFITPPNYEASDDDDLDNVYEVTITASDDVNADVNKMIEITVNNVLEGVLAFADIITNISIAENTGTDEVIHTAMATGEGSITYTLSGVDMDKFDINSSRGELTFKASPDHENPVDDDGGNVYDIVITADNGMDTAVEQTVSITVTDIVNMFATSSTNISIAENTETDEVIHTAMATGEGSITYTLSGIDMNLFNINANTGELTFKTSPDYENPVDDGGGNVYDIVITADNGMDTAVEQTVSITVTDIVNMFATSSTNISVEENIPSTTDIYTAFIIEALLPQYSITGGADMDKFDIDMNTGELTFKASPDYENPVDNGRDNIYNIVITSLTAQLGISTPTQTVVITVNNVSGFSSNTINFASVPLQYFEFVDLDGDSDMDIVGGNNNTKIRYFLNNNGNYVEQKDSANPFNHITNHGNSLIPALADLDGDGDFDLVVGNFGGNILYFSNKDGVYEEKTGGDNPFDGIDVGDFARPTFGDIDKDNDIDLVIGERAGNINYYSNNNDGTFTEKTGVENPFNGISIVGSGGSQPKFFDIDNDGDLDFISGRLGEGDPRIRHYTNNNGNFVDQTFTGLLSHIQSATGDFPFVVSVGDISGNGFLDLIIYDNGTQMSQQLVYLRDP